MAPKSLKSRIDDLFNALGGPVADRPAGDKVRSELAVFASLAEALENSEATSEAEKQIADLQAALEQSEMARAQSDAAREQSEAKNRELKAALQAVKAEIKRFREEEKQREADEADLPGVQFDILRRLPSENSGIPWTLPEISYLAQIPVDEAEIHIDRLERDGLIKRTWGHSGHVWYRTIAGSKFVLAKRLAGDEQKRPKRYKHADLLKDAHEALLLIARSEEGIKEFELTTRCGPNAHMTLGALHNELFFNSDLGPGGLRAGRILTLAKKGADYLTERGLL